jgi:hypothetical protein
MLMRWTVFTIAVFAMTSMSFTAWAEQARTSFLPTGDATKIVTVTKGGQTQIVITVLTEAVAVKETGPKVTIKKFGEVYPFSPSSIVVHREEPTRIEFWSLHMPPKGGAQLTDQQVEALAGFVYALHRANIRP